MATWKADGGTQVEVYTRDGKLGFVVDSAKGGGSSFIYLGNLRIAEDAWQCSTGTRTATYFHADLLGSPVAETDAARTVLTRTHYAPYGEALNRTVDGPGYTGHMMDAATGLVYAQQRYYDPVIGRFLSIDPVAADADSGSNFNRYWYANNNPYRFTDPDGRAVDTIIDAGFVVVDAGRFLGAAAATLVGAVTGDEALQAAGVEGLRETGADLAASTASLVVPGLPAPALRGGLKAAEAAGDAARSQRAATREAKRQAGIPTSQQAKSQTSGRASDGTKAGRQQSFEVPKAGGGTETKSVQVSRDTRGEHAGAPQIEAGTVKPGGQVDSAGRPRIQNEGKVRVDFDPR